LVISQYGEPAGFITSLIFAGLFVLLGGIEGLIVGFAQAKVLSPWVPSLRGWVQATVVGAVIAWALGMAPSTVMSILPSGNSGPPPEMGQPFQLLLASGLGIVAGPILAFFQWRRLRPFMSHGAGWWIPANAAAWALGMPAIFIGAHFGASAPNTLLALLTVGLSLLAAGVIVGAVHGCVMWWLISQNREHAA
jgi:hypothetical protein